MPTADVNTQTPEGKARLRRVAKQCVKYGQRVQNSVFECVLDAAQCAIVTSIPEKTIDPAKDSLRFYYLGNNYHKKVEHIGAKPSLDMEGTLIV